MKQVLLLTALVIAFILSGTSVCLAAEELDDLLSGFEEEQVKDDVAEENGDGLDELFSGFDETVHGNEENEQVQEENRVFPSWYSVSGSLGLRVVAGFSHEDDASGEPDYGGLSSLRFRGELVQDIRVERFAFRFGVKGFVDAGYVLSGERSEYTDSFLDAYESELEMHEAYMQAAVTEFLDVKVGRQIISWGKSDNIRITDILNPLDMREPGMVDIRDMRLPVTMTRIDLYKGSWNLIGVVIHEPRFSRIPVYNGEFFQGEASLPTENIPGMSWENQQYGLALEGIFSGWDASLYMASVFNDSAHIEMVSPGEMARVHNRIFMVGGAVNAAIGNWLLKGETAWFEGFEYFTVDGKKSRIDLLAGIEYSGFSETTIGIEVANRHIVDFEAAMEEYPDAKKRDQTQFAFRVQRDFFHDTLHVTFLASMYGAAFEGGGFQRAQCEYELNDTLSITTGVVLYQSGDEATLSEIGDSDRLFLNMEYSF